MLFVSSQLGTWRRCETSRLIPANLTCTKYVGKQQVVHNNTTAAVATAKQYVALDVYTVRQWTLSSAGNSLFVKSGTTKFLG